MVRSDTEAGRVGLTLIIVIRTIRIPSFELELFKISLESLILAQDERWRRA
jgi:hypothetical protein